MQHVPKSIRSVAVGLVILTIVISLPLPLFSRQWHLLLHIVGAVIFLGNLVVTAVWMSFAVANRDRAVVHFAAKLVTAADLLLTFPGLALILVNGIYLAELFDQGNLFKVGWIAVSLILFALSGVVWSLFLLPHQSRLITLSQTELAADFNRVFARWSLWGAVATLLPLVSLGLMVFKPILW